MKYLIWLFALIFIGLGAIDSLSSAHAGAINWRVENAFRYFSDVKHFDLHRTAYAELSIFEKLHPILSAERRLGRDRPRGWAGDIFKHVCNGKTAGSGGCDTSKTPINPIDHSVIASLNTTSLDDGNCIWKIIARQKRYKSARKYNKTINAPCTKPLIFKSPFSGGVTLSVRNNGTLLDQISVRVNDIFIVGMGDSFASGEGNPDQAVTFSRERSALYGQLPHGTVLAGYPARIGSWKKGRRQ